MIAGDGSSQCVQKLPVTVIEAMLIAAKARSTKCARWELSVPEKRERGLGSSIGEAIGLLLGLEEENQARISSADTSKIVKSGEVSV